VARCGAASAPTGSVSGVFDEALLRVLVDSDPIPAAVVQHVVTGEWPVPELFCDIAFIQPE
jgi:hypothetical protein